MEQLYKRILPALISYCRKLTRDAAAAMDLVQDTFLNIIKCGIDPATINDSYIYHTARNIYFNQQRDRRLESASVVRSSPDEEGREFDPVAKASLKKYQEERADERARENALSQIKILDHVFSRVLKEEEVELIMLRVVDKLDYKTIAERRGKPYGQVQHATSLAVKKLRYQVFMRIKK
jgi:RNA polymerase sigma factor (sigma-70 family)